MASTDWTFLNDGLDIATVDRGVTAGVARPPGGGADPFGPPPGGADPFGPPGGDPFADGDPFA